MNTLPIRSRPTKIIWASFSLLLLGLAGCNSNTVVHDAPTNERNIIYQTREHLSGVSVNAQEIVDTHNRYRAEVGVPNLTWSDKLAGISQKWADNLKANNGCRMKHTPNNPYGENLFWASPTSWSDGQVTLQAIRSSQVVDDWGHEKNWYNYQKNNCQPGKQCGHYTQMVWKSTTQVGCAVSICPNKSQVWACTYNPPGNYVGVRPY